MSRARRVEARRAAPYQAQIPRVQARVQSTNLSPIANIQARIDGRRQFLEDVGDTLLTWQRDRITNARQDAATQAGGRANLSIHPGTSRTRVNEQWNLIWTYYRAAQLVFDRLERSMHARTIYNILVRNEMILSHMVRMPSSALPRPADLEGVIVRETTVRNGLGDWAARALENERPDPAPWPWQAQARNIPYLQHQAILRDRQRAQFETGITIPRPCAVHRPHIERFANYVSCLVLPPRD